MTALSGLIVALATPFTRNDEIDLRAYRTLVRRVFDHGGNGVVALGSTGEASALSEAERDRVVAATVEAAGGRTVLVGTGHSSTRQTCWWTQRAQALGAAAALVVTPPYVKPTPRGLREHFAAVAAAAPGLPIVAYNVPSRTGCNLEPHVLDELWSIEQVVAVKESSGNLQQIATIAAALPPGKALLAGDDALALPSLAVGACGLVSVIGNVLPGPTAELIAAARQGDLERARNLHERLLPLMLALGRESNPIPLKAALAVQGVAENVLRLPLVPASDATMAAVRAALAAIEVRA